MGKRREGRRKALHFRILVQVFLFQRADCSKRRVIFEHFLVLLVVSVVAAVFSIGGISCDGHVFRKEHPG
jgi:hypothetical protein